MGKPNKRIPELYSDSGDVDSTQWEQLRLSSLEQSMGYEHNTEADEGYPSYVKTSKPKQRGWTQPGEVGYTRRQNQEGIRRFRRGLDRGDG